MGLIEDALHGLGEVTLAVEDGMMQVTVERSRADARQQRVETARHVVEVAPISACSRRSRRTSSAMCASPWARLPRPRRRVLGASLRSMVPLLAGTSREGPEPTIRGTAMSTIVVLVTVRPGMTSDM
jgi:hypothetical protein